MVSAYGSNMGPITKCGEKRDTMSMQRLYPALHQSLVNLHGGIGTGAGPRTM